MKYKPRLIEMEIDPLFEVFPIVTITGPRQAGKSTLIKHYINSEWRYYTLDDRDLLLRIRNDPALFISSLNTNTAIDEAQKCPELFHFLKKLVDEGYKHKIILSGSANLLLLQTVTESLVGRAGFLELLPFSVSESLSLKSNELLKIIMNAKNIEDLKKKLILKKREQISDEQLLKHILYGGFPPVANFNENQSNILRWFGNYITAYIERDLRNLAQVGDLDTFQMVYKMLAYQVGNIINYSNIAQDLGITSNTVKRYLTILETSYQFKRVPSYHIMQKKKIIKAKKIFMNDTGILNYLQQNLNIEKMIYSNNWGAILENHIFAEIMKSIIGMSPKPYIYYWRTNNGAEVDFIIEYNNKLIPIEVKSGIRIRKSSIRGLKSFIGSQTNIDIPFGIVLYRGKEIFEIEKNIIALPISIFF